ncbi:MAG: hypothetical protein FWF28_03835, partial [Micrococcales bacterium]|nr:hypothetical protein [Micrococcales bacterium]
LQRSAGPAGLITASVADLLTFARLHLRDGVTADGERVLGAGSAQAMRAWCVDAAFELSQVIFGELFDELCGVAISNLPEPPHDPPQLDIGPWAGTHGRAELAIDIVDELDGPWLQTTARGELAGLDDTPVRRCRMELARDGLYFVFMDQMHLNVPVWLCQPGSGERYVHVDGRAARKAG